ncbi:MAG: hypothetical protein Q4G64_01275 [bacterium]|nr:hypothetical protein [bacterium]
MDWVALGETALDVIVRVFVISSMFTLGARTKPADFLVTVRFPLLLGAVLLANFVLIPAWAFGVSGVLGLPLEIHQGVVILGFVAGAPFVFQLGTIARENVGVLAGAMALLLVGTAVVTPLVLPLVLPGAAVDALQLALLLASTMLLPLAVGMAFRALAPGLAPRIAPWTGKLAFASMIGMIVVQLAISLPVLTAVGWRPYAAAILLIAGAFGIGWLTGFAGRGTGVTPVGTAILASQRNMAAGMLVATSSFGNAAVTIIMVTGMVAFAALVPLCRWIGARRAARELGDPPAAGGRPA